MGFSNLQHDLDTWIQTCDMIRTKEIIYDEELVKVLASVLVVDISHLSQQILTNDLDVSYENRLMELEETSNGIQDTHEWLLQGWMQAPRTRMLASKGDERRLQDSPVLDGYEEEEEPIRN